MKFSSKIQRCELSPMRKFLPYELAAEAKGRKIYHLNIGQPDVKTPEAFYEAIRDFKAETLEYAPAPGLPAHIEAVQAYYAKLGVKLDKDDILATSGGGEALEFILACILDEGDELLPAAVEVVLETGQASVSMLQRRLKLGYSRAARLVDQMEERGIVGPFEGSKPRQLLITRAQWQEMQMGGAPAPEADEPPFPTEEET